MPDKEIIIGETIGVARGGEPVRVGLPFAKGELAGTEKLRMAPPEGDEQPVQATVLKRWKDGSVKWLLVDFLAWVPAHGRVVYRLVTAGEGKVVSPPSIHIAPGADRWLVDTGAAVFTIDAWHFKPFSRVIADGRELLAEGSVCAMTTADAARLVPLIESISVESEGPLRAVLYISGRLSPIGDGATRFYCRLHFFAGSSRVIIEFTIRNGQPARHPGGLWDLGDAGSILFRELAFDFSFADRSIDEVVCSPAQGVTPVSVKDSAERFTIYQESSGGANWQSPVHRNRQGVVPFTLRGYEVVQGDVVTASGDRATPALWCGAGSTGVAAVLPRFWQEFPKAFEADRHGMKISLFPARFPDLHELQGGEQKTHVIYLDFATHPEGLHWARVPLTASAAPEVFHHYGLFSDLSLPMESEGEADLADMCISGPEEFLGKRKVADEYGWRNFGDIYGDHEAVYHRGEKTFVSHYNNQYDVCAGMYRKFLAGCGPLWGEIAADLARHVIDIDIYHAEGDREEYNGGLFWHTDHYIDAGLSTHRSFSREHLVVKDPRFCGGGPAAEHCYTSGLMLHYYLTGDPSFRDAVIGLAEWVICSLQGAQTILAALKRGIRYLKLWRKYRGCRLPFPRYPLTRGTGNAITACVDAFEADGGRRFLETAEEMIRGTIHPGDDIDARDLLNAEVAWSYTVFLTALAKFLDKKLELGELDSGYAYARACLLAYAEWMVEHEYPYLDRPEILEYPNETWAAQDLRKSVIFYHAARYADISRREIFQQKNRHFFKAAREALLKHQTSSFIRPLALMLQNGWVGLKPEVIPSAAVSSQTTDFYFGQFHTPYVTFGSVLRRFCSDVLSALQKTSVKKELSWLKSRLPSKVRVSS